MSIQKWSRAVWIEKEEEVEGVVPTIWIVNKYVMWPTGVGAMKAMREERKPEEKWTKFFLVKIKFQSDNKHECEDYDDTTTAEMSEQEYEIITKAKRNPKKKNFPDFVTDGDEMGFQSEHAEDPNHQQDDLTTSESNQGLADKGGKPTNLPKVPEKVGPLGKLLSTSGRQKHAELSSERHEIQLPNPPRFELSASTMQSCSAVSTSQSGSAAVSLREIPRPVSEPSRGEQSPRSRSASPLSFRSMSRSSSRSPVNRSHSYTLHRRSSSPRHLHERNSSSRRLHQRSNPARHLDQHSHSPRRLHQRINSPRHLDQCSHSPRRLHQRINSPRHLDQRSNSPRHLHQRSDSPRHLDQHSNSPRRLHQHINSPRHLHRRSNSPYQYDSRYGPRRPSYAGSFEALRRNDETPKSSRSSEIVSHSGFRPHSTNVFPLSEEKFQRRALYLLTEIRDWLKRRPSVIENDAEQFNFAVAQNLQDLDEIEQSLADPVKQSLVKKHLRKIGGTDAKDQMKKAMQRFLSNSVMALMSVKGKREKFAFRKTKLCSIIVETVLSTHTEATESDVYLEMGKFLRYAPERSGGGGRRK